MGQWMGASLEEDTEAKVNPQTCQSRLEADVGFTAQTELRQELGVLW